MNYKGIRVTWDVRKTKRCRKKAKANVFNNLILFCNHIGASPKSRPSETYSALTTLTPESDLQVVLVVFFAGMGVK